MPPQLQGVIRGGGYRKGTGVVASQRALTLPHPSLQPPSQLGTSCFPTKPPRAPGLPLGREKGQPVTSRPSRAEETHGSMRHTGPRGLKAWALRAGLSCRLSPRARHGTQSSQNPDLKTPLPTQSTEPAGTTGPAGTMGSCMTSRDSVMR